MACDTDRITFGHVPDIKGTRKSLKFVAAALRTVAGNFGWILVHVTPHGGGKVRVQPPFINYAYAGRLRLNTEVPTEKSQPS